MAGVALFDYDNDGRLDVFLTNGATHAGAREDASPSTGIACIRNLGGCRFEDVTEKAGVKGHGYDNGVATGDFDNDGVRRPVRGRAAARTSSTATAATARSRT